LKLGQQGVCAPSRCCVPFSLLKKKIYLSQFEGAGGEDPDCELRLVQRPVPHLLVRWFGLVGLVWLVGWLSGLFGLVRWLVWLVCLFGWLVGMCIWVIEV
jgi:hypothetical protein